MTVEKRYQFGGLDLRQSDLVVEKFKATDLKNVELNYAGELIKRNGYEIEARMPIDKNIISLIHYKEKNELVAMSNDGLYRKVGANFVKIPESPQTEGDVIWTGKVSHVEINGTLFISDQTGENFVHKYDGKRFYRAGMPKLEINQSSAGDGTIRSRRHSANFNFGSQVIIPDRRDDDGANNDDLDSPYRKLFIREQQWFYYYQDIRPVATNEFPPNDQDESEWVLRQIIDIDLRDYTGDVDTHASFYLSVSRSGNMASFLVRDFTNDDYHRLHIFKRDTVSNAFEILQTLDFDDFSIGENCDSLLTGSNEHPVDISFDEDYIIVGNTGTGSVGLVQIFEQVTTPGTFVLLDTVFPSEVTPGTPTDNWGKSVYFLDSIEEILITGYTRGGETHISRFFTNGTDGEFTHEQELNNPNAGTFDNDYGQRKVSVQDDGRTNLRQAFTLGVYGNRQLTGDPAGSGVIFWYSRDHGSSNTDFGLRDTYYAGKDNFPGSKTAGDQFGADHDTGQQFQISGPIANRYPKRLTVGVPGSGTGSAIYVNYDPSNVVVGTGQVVETITHPSDPNEPSFGKVFAVQSRLEVEGTQSAAVFFARTFPVIGSYLEDFDGLADSGAVSLFSYDGADFTDYPTVGTANFFRAFYNFLDKNLNLINGNFGTLESAASFNIVVPNFTADGFREFGYLYIRGVEANNNIVGITSDDEELLIEYDSTNVAAGDTLYILTVTNNFSGIAEYAPVTVISVDDGAKEVLLDVSALVSSQQIFGTYFDEQGVKYFYNLDCSNISVPIFTSLDEFFNYFLLDPKVMTYGGLLIPDADFEEQTSFIIDADLDDLTVDVAMDDVYDTTIVKEEIPKIKFLTSYQNRLVGANIIYPDRRQQIGFKNRILWSDLSIGGSLESFAPFDFTEIGLNNDRELTGVFGAQDSINVFKSNRIYFINGLLVAGEFRVRESLSEGIGAVSHNSIVEVGDGALFMSDRGMYHVMGGNKPGEISDVNEPLFKNTNIDLTNAVAVLDNIGEKMYMFLDDGLVPTPNPNNRLIFYDYYFKQWFLLEDVPMSGPIAFFDGELHIADGQVVRHPASDFRDEILEEIAEPLLHIWNFTAVADVGGSLFGTYFIFSTEDADVTYALWYDDINNPGAYPAPPDIQDMGYQLQPIEIEENDTSVEVANKTQAVMDTETPFTVGPVGTGGPETFPVATPNRGLVDPNETDAGTSGVTIVTTQTGSDGVFQSEFVNVTGSYSTGWMDLQEAALRKKFVNLVLFSLNRIRDFSGTGTNRPNYDLTVKTQVDWINKDKEEFIVSFTDEVRTDDHKLAITQNKSIRFIFENSENIGMLLTGYQFEWQATQGKPKGVR